MAEEAPVSTEAPVAPAAAPAETAVDPRAVLPRKSDGATPSPAPEAKPDAATEVKSEAKPAAEEETPESAARREAMRLRRKLDKAHRQRAEEQGRAELYRKELESLRAPAKVEGEPTLAQFDYDPEKYATAKAEFVKTQTAKDLQAKTQEQATKQYREQLSAKWDDHVDTGASKYPDWSDIVGELTPDTPFTAAIMDTENASDVAYHLGKNPAEAQRIAKLPPLSQVREIGKIEAKLLAEPPKVKAPSKAPAPITPLSGTAPVVSDKPLPSDSDEEWIRKRSLQVHRRR